MVKRPILALIHILESFTEWTGKLISWLTLFMVLIVVAVLVLRNIFGISAIPLQESVTYMHGIVFMLGAAYTLKHHDHVRVDVFYHRFSHRTKALVDMAGFLILLLPVCIFLIVYSLDYVIFNWKIKEGSSQPGGLPYLYMFKTVLLALPITLIIQGTAQFLHNLAYLLSWKPLPHGAEEDTESVPQMTGDKEIHHG
ncbi:TRAP transporter small permease subunit [Kangiella sp. M94]